MSCKNRFFSGSAEISGVVFSICGISFATCIPVAKPVCFSISSTKATVQDLSEISATFVKSVLHPEKQTRLLRRNACKEVKMVCVFAG